MMLKLVRGGRLLSAAPRLRVFLPALTPVLTAAISSSAGSNSSSLLTTESLHARYSGYDLSELKEQLAARNLKTGGKKSQLVERLASDDIFRSRGLSTSSQQSRSRQVHAPVGEVPEIPKPIEVEAAGESEKPIRVPIAPDNEFARYHRHENVPVVAPPTEHVVTTVLPDANDAVEVAGDALADFLEEISVEAKAHKTEEQYAKEHNEVKELGEDAIRNIASGVRRTMPKEDSLLYLLARFPVEVMKDMMEDVFSTTQQHAKSGVKQERKEQQKEAKDEGPQQLDSSQRRALYAIGGLSAGWYIFGF